MSSIICTVCSAQDYTACTVDFLQYALFRSIQKWFVRDYTVNTVQYTAFTVEDYIARIIQTYSVQCTEYTVCTVLEYTAVLFSPHYKGVKEYTACTDSLHMWKISLLSMKKSVTTSLCPWKTRPSSYTAIEEASPFLSFAPEKLYPLQNLTLPISSLAEASLSLGAPADFTPVLSASLKKLNLSSHCPWWS